MNVHRTEAGPPGGAPPPRGQESPGGFDILLALHEDEARTATAEGHEKDRGDGHDHGVRAHGDPSVTPGHTKRAERDAAETAETAEAPVAPVDPETVPVDGEAVPTVPVAEETAAVPVVAAPAAPVVAVAPAAAAAPAPAPSPVATPVETVPAPATAATAAPVVADVAPVVADVAPVVAGEPVPAAPVAEGKPLPTGPVVVAAGEEQPAAAATSTPEAAVEGTAPAAAAAERPAAAATPAAEQPATTDAPTEEQAAPVTAAPARGRGEASPNANGARAAEVHEALAAGETPGRASESAQPVAPPPAAPAAQAAAHTRPVPNAAQALQLAETALQLRDLAHIAAARGVARARLQLHPAELGGIDVRLRVTAEGLSASIAAERPEALQALQQAGAELRRSLEQRGLTVISVDIALAAPSGGHANGGETQTGGDRSSAGTTDRNGGQEAAADAMEADQTAPRGVPAGALVDVLA